MRYWGEPNVINWDQSLNYPKYLFQNQDQKNKTMSITIKIKQNEFCSMFVLRCLCFVQLHLNLLAVNRWSLAWMLASHVGLFTGFYAFHSAYQTHKRKKMKIKIGTYIKAKGKNNISILELPPKSNTMYLMAGFQFVSFDCNSREMTSWDFSWCCQVK